jgi:hypothetical protein
LKKQSGAYGARNQSALRRFIGKAEAQTLPTSQYFGTNGLSSVALDGMGNSPDNKNRGIE